MMEIYRKDGQPIRLAVFCSALAGVLGVLAPNTQIAARYAGEVESLSKDITFLIK